MRSATEQTDEPIAQADLEEFGPEVEALLDAARDLASALELPRLLEVLLDHMKRLVDYSGTSIWELQGHDLTFLGFRGPNAFNQDVAKTVRFHTPEMEPHWARLAAGEPIRMPDIWDESDVARMFRRVVGGSAMRPSLDVITSLMWVPLVIRDRAIGLLSLTSPRFDAFSRRDASLALAIARQAAVAIENARLHGRARHAAMLEERQRLARELHDSVTQGLYGVALYTAAARHALSDGDLESVRGNLRDIAETTQEAVGEMRQLLVELRPQILDEHGLATALWSRLEAVHTHAGIAVEFDCADDVRLASEAEQELYRVAQEALNNVLKHSRATRVRVAVTQADGRVAMEIADDGVGFEPEIHMGGFGVSGMRERVVRLGGSLRVDSTPGEGTFVRIEVPA
jgi:signal transduction histidine kinase